MSSQEQADEQEKGLQELGRLPSKVRDRLFLGSCYNGRSKEALAECGITHVINVAEDVADPDEDVRQLVTYERVNIREKENEFRNQVATYKAIIDKILAALKKDENNAVLVHCRQGHSRSASVLIAFLMQTEGMDLGAASASVQQRRSAATPNRLMAAQLEVLQHTLAPASTDSH